MGELRGTLSGADDPLPIIEIMSDESKSGFESFLALDQSVWHKLLTSPVVAELDRISQRARILAEATFPDVGTLAARLSLPELKPPEFKLPEMLQFPEIDTGPYLRNLTEAIEKLASNFWSIPWHLDLSQTQELANLTPEEIDQYLEEFFDGGAFTDLRKDVMGDASLDRWKTLLSQCFRNFETGEFHICIPSLILVLEGSFNYEAFFKEKRRKEFFRQKIKSASEFDKVTWISLNRFCDVLFAPTGKGRINRNRILHGRDQPSNWKRVDCLRLFQALDSTRRIK